MIVGEPPIQVLKVVIHSFQFHGSTWRLGSIMNPVFNQWNISDNLPEKHRIIGFDQCHVFQTNPNTYTIANILIRLVCPRTSHDLSSPSNQNCHIYIYICLEYIYVYTHIYIYTYILWRIIICATVKDGTWYRLWSSIPYWESWYRVRSEMDWWPSPNLGESISSGRADPKHLLT